mmetsp:Transcript_46084/g.99850  ORF Transcript_46084/g.99850 Transcript_46084/m.99850 type:complete len:142 (+) Transcript_46084:2-427(+)
MASEFAGTVFVTFAYLLLYYVFITFQALAVFKAGAAAKKAGEKFQRYYNASNPLVLKWDRAVGNMHEQMGPFLTTLWLYSRFVDPIWGARLGWVYVAGRATWPILYQNTWIGKPRIKILLSTVPNYGIIGFFGFESVRAML